LTAARCFVAGLVEWLRLSPKRALTFLRIAHALKPSDVDSRRVLFAAPAEIHAAIVDLLPGDVRQRIVEHVKSDLVKVEPARLISHFRSLRQI
jgi:hypothetical protein